MNDPIRLSESMRATFSSAPDLTVRNVRIGQNVLSFVFLDGMTDGKELEDAVLFPLLRAAPARFTFDDVNAVVSFAGTVRAIPFDDAPSSVACGEAVLLTPDDVLSFSARKTSERSVSEPPTSAVVKGPREGFVESVKTNCALLRKRLKTPDLVVKETKIGTRTDTKVYLLYLRSVLNEEIVTTIEEKLSAVSVDGVPDSSYLTHILEERPYSLFKQVGNSEKPDVVASKILDGKVAILCDGSPIVLYVPFALIEDFDDLQDAYKRPLRATFLRYVRLFGAFMALFLPALFVAVQTYQFQLLPLELLSTVINSTGRVPFSPTLEMLIALLLFEILGEASIRMPRPIGLALGVVGAIVLGETAVQAGLLSSLTVLVVAMSGVGMYAVPDETGTLGTLRLFFVLSAGLLGLLGLLVAALSIVAYLNGLTVYGVPYLTPLAPLFGQDLRDAIFKRNLTDARYRFASFALKNKIRVRRKS